MTRRDLDRVLLCRRDGERIEGFRPPALRPTERRVAFPNHAKGPRPFRGHCPGMPE